MGAAELVIAVDDADWVAQVRGLADARRGADAVIEAVGTPDTWQAAMGMVRGGGTVNFFGGCRGNSHVPIDTSLIHYSEVTLKSSFHHTPRHIRQALDIIRRRDLRSADFRHQRSAAVRSALGFPRNDEPQRPSENGDPAVNPSFQGDGALSPLLLQAARNRRQGPP